MNRIREVREAAGVTQSVLYRQLGWKQPRLANYEAGIRTPSLGDARAIVAALNALGVVGDLVDVFPPETEQQPEAMAS